MRPLRSRYRALTHRHGIAAEARCSQRRRTRRSSENLLALDLGESDPIAGSTFARQGRMSLANRPCRRRLLCRNLGESIVEEEHAWVVGGGKGDIHAVGGGRRDGD